MFWIVAEEVADGVKDHHGMSESNRPVSYAMMKKINDNLKDLNKAFLTRKMLDNYDYNEKD